MATSRQKSPSPPRKPRDSFVLGFAVLIILALGGGLVSYWWNTRGSAEPDAVAEQPRWAWPWQVVPPWPAPPVEARPVAVDPLDQALNNLRSGDIFARQEAATRLATMEPKDERRAEVLRALETVLPGGDVWLKTEAAKAMSVWGPKECVPALIGLLEDRDHGVRWEVLGILGRLKDERAAEPMTRCLAHDGQTAVAALIAMGPVAEKPLIARLKQESWGGQLTICRILKETGTSESIPALEEVSHEQTLAARTAEEALRAIRARERQKGEAAARNDF